MTLLTGSISEEIIAQYKLFGQANLVAHLIIDKSVSKRFDDLVQESNGKPSLALLKLRKEIILNKNVSKKEFVNEYEKNKKKSLENLFQHPIHSWQISRLDSLIADKIKTLTELYDQFRMSFENINLLLR